MMLLKCSKCGVKNYLDPYPFWDFKGKTKCAGCDTIYALETDGGHLVGKVRAVSGKPTDPDVLLPGFADTSEFEPILGEGKTRPAPRARPDVYGKPKPVTRNLRGRLVSGRPLKPDELIGSRVRFIVEGKEP
ncbi:MAG: hypothetical protein A2X51_09450 [Candidatus Rokubacteria bacterium GWC2_70_24]|nr:MAG: hypothetical protein A2X53_10370 [Candidatus Rokubacteria bacterium GWA2_70_23]OGK92790.1 MAG: hypothetical protein A2X51_09450 [Candidatus Rokubacteria bacterium GWC2_70_24]